MRQSNSVNKKGGATNTLVAPPFLLTLFDCRMRCREASDGDAER